MATAAQLRFEPAESVALVLLRRGGSRNPAPHALPALARHSSASWNPVLSFFTSARRPKSCLPALPILLVIPAQAGIQFYLFSLSLRVGLHLVCGKPSPRSSRLRRLPVMGAAKTGPDVARRKRAEKSENAAARSRIRSDAQGKQESHPRAVASGSWPWKEVKEQSLDSSLRWNDELQDKRENELLATSPPLLSAGLRIAPADKARSESNAAGSGLRRR